MNPLRPLAIGARLVPFVALTLLFGASPLFARPAASPQDHEMWRELVKKAGITLVEAVDRGLARAQSGVVFHAELEVDRGRLVYSIDVARGTEVFNAVFAAADAELVETETEDEDHAALVAAAKLGVKDAIADALKRSPGTAIEAQLVMAKEKPVFRIRIVTEQAIELHEIDASSGRGAAKREEDRRFTDRFPVAKEDLAAAGRNPFFVLEPGFELVLEGMDDGDEVRLVITVLDETRVVDGVTTRIVEERESKNGELVEISRNFFAISKHTNDVYYFGEEVDFHEEGRVVRHDGAWVSGEGGARFGLMMPGSPLLGARYCQEIAPEVAMDRAEVLELDAAFETPAGRFVDCLVTRESTPLERGSERKTYARGIGLVQDASLRLVRHGMR